MKDIRKVVKEGYEKGAYVKTFRIDTSKLSRFELNMLRELTKKLHKKSKILDLGCGIGAPYDNYFVKKGFDVTGVDFSKKHILMARKNVPKARFIEKDFTKVKFSYSFDAIVSFYAIFHIPRKENPKLFLKINKLLKPNGLILVSLGTGNEEYGEEKNWAGAKVMAWSTYSPEKYKEIIKKAGFNIIKSVFEGKPGDKEHHFWVLAKKLK